MEASVGDRIIVESNRVGTGSKRGVVLEVLGSAATRHYRVRWDDGHENLFFPSSDASVEHTVRS